MNETFILIQTIIENVEFATLAIEYRSKFNYLDDKHLEIKTYYWQQAAAYKQILEHGLDIIIKIEDSKLIIIDLSSNNKKAEE